MPLEIQKIIPFRFILSNVILTGQTETYMLYLIYTIQLIFLAYMVLLLMRMLGSVFKSLQNHALFRFILYCTDPYLNIFRRFIPVIGGTLDLSPLVGFFVLRLLEWLVIKLLITLFTLP